MNKIKKKIKVLIPTGTRADFPRIEPLVELIYLDKNFELLIACTGSHLLDSYGLTYNYLKKKYNKNIAKFKMFEDPPDDTQLGIAKSFSNCCNGFSKILKKFNPDLCIITVDRIETLAFASICSIMNYPILHIQGGELSGTIDENIRHAVSKLSHVHSTANEDARLRVIQMGESKNKVFNTGCPYSKKLIEVSKESKKNTKIVQSFLGKHNISQNFSIFCYHPVTTDKKNYGYNNLNLKNIFKFILKYTDIILIHPNSDLGYSIFLKKTFSDNRIKFFKNIEPNIFLPLLSLSKCLIGNSSSGIREASYFGTPVLNIGNRQKGRLSGSNVINCKPKNTDIINSLKVIFSNYKRYKKERLYGDKNAANRIISIIKNINWNNIELSKNFIDVR